MGLKAVTFVGRLARFVFPHPLRVRSQEGVHDAEALLVMT